VRNNSLQSLCAVQTLICPLPPKRCHVTANRPEAQPLPLGPPLTTTTRPFMLIYAHNYYQALRATWDPQLLTGPSCYLGPTTTTRPFVLIYAHNYYQALRAIWDPQILPGPSCYLRPTTATKPFVLIYTHNYYQALRATWEPQLLPGPSC